ncbi:hypothetical protein OY671_008404, partial [Metschnikowia pulcherrima]
MGFGGYFSIVADFIKWAKEHSIPVGPGRGSGAGSLVTWASTITDLDPIRSGSSFERFLNPERVSMPDFDIDFCQGNRDRVIDYVKDRYGRDAVSQIATFGTMAAKAASRDVGRVSGMGDIVASVEEVTKGVDIAAAQKSADKVKAGADFDFDDFSAQISQMKKMGGSSGLIDKLPTELASKAGQADMDKAERDMRRMEGIIRSMSAKERRQPALSMDGKSKASRKRRIAQGAGVQIQDVNRSLNQFEQMQTMMKKMKGGGLFKMMKR